MIRKEFELAHNAVALADNSPTLHEDLCKAADLIVKKLRAGGTLFVAGNGGSATQAEHLVAELIVKFIDWRCPIPAMALTTSGAILTAAENDCKEAQVGFLRQVEALCGEKDVLLVLSTSGASANLINAAIGAVGNKTAVVGLLGIEEDCELGDWCDVVVFMPQALGLIDKNVTRHIQLLHLVCLHTLVMYIEEWV